MTATAIVLASGSPRRRRLLEMLGIDFEVVPAETDETPYGGEAPIAYASRAAREKALEVAGRRPDQPILAADTVVDIEDEIVGKPESDEDAARMLRRLSGRTHQVHTALALVFDHRCHEIVDSAHVRFVDLVDEVIRWYVATGEPADKAGAYAVQGLGGLLIAGIDGSPHTVVGLPIHRLPEIFAAQDLDFWSRLK
jgi:septum formation protein